MMGSTYKFDNKYRGQAIIIVNKHFETRPIRYGCEHDLKNMFDMFVKLDFFVKPYSDLTAKKMKETIQKAIVDAEKNKKSDCFVLVVSSHGGVVEDKKHPGIFEQVIYGKDDGMLYVKDIMDMLDTKYTSTGLNGKPKLCFLQACRSTRVKINGAVPDKFDPGIKVYVPRKGDQGNSNDNSDHKDGSNEDIGKMVEENDMKLYADWGKDVDEDVCSVHALDPNGMPKGATSDASDTDHKESVEQQDPLPPVPFDVVPAYCPRDCIIVYPVSKHKTAIRNEDIGSYLMSYLHRNMQLLHDGKGLMYYLTIVSADMARGEYYKKARKACVNIIHRLTADLRFTPKCDTSTMAKFVAYFKRKLNK